MEVNDNPTNWYRVEVLRGIISIDVRAPSEDIAKSRAATLLREHMEALVMEEREANALETMATRWGRENYSVIRRVELAEPLPAPASQPDLRFGRPMPILPDEDG